MKQLDEVDRQVQEQEKALQRRKQAEYRWGIINQALFRSVALVGRAIEEKAFRVQNGDGEKRTEIKNGHRIQSKQLRIAEAREIAIIGWINQERAEQDEGGDENRKEIDGRGLKKQIQALDDRIGKQRCSDQRITQIIED